MIRLLTRLTRSFSRSSATGEVPLDLRAIQAETACLRRELDLLAAQVAKINERFDRIEAAAESIGDAAVFLRQAKRTGSPS